MATINNRAGVPIRVGVAATVPLEVLACIAADVSLAGADLRNVVLDGLDLSGLQAPEADFTGGSMKGITANKLVNGKMLELSAAQLQGVPITSTTPLLVNLACTHPTAFRADLAATSVIRGVDWSECPDVIVLPVKDDTVGKVIAFRNGSGWKVHAGAKGVLAEATAKSTLASDPKYTAAMAWLDTPEAVAAKAAIDARPVGSGTVVKPAGGAQGAQVKG